MFSVVIPIFNKAHTIEKTLQSVLEQTFQDFEVIIVNDGSTDDFRKKINKYLNGEKIKLIHQVNSGVSAARNLGVANARFEYIAFLDADDRWESTYLETMNSAIKDYPDAGLICCAGYVRNAEKNATRIASKYKGKILKINYFENPHVFTHISATVVTKKAFIRVNGFLVGMKKNEDFAFLFSVALREVTIYCGIPLSTYFGGIEGQLTSTHSNSDKFIPDIAKRFNFCYKVWLDIRKDNCLFLVFEKYELRHIVLGYIRKGQYSFLNKLIGELSEDVLSDFSRLERYIWIQKRLRYLALWLIYSSKIIWRLRRFPVVNN